MRVKAKEHFGYYLVVNERFADAKEHLKWAVDESKRIAEQSGSSNSNRRSSYEPWLAQSGLRIINRK